MFGKLIKALAGNKMPVKLGAAEVQRGDKGVLAKISPRLVETRRSKWPQIRWDNGDDVHVWRCTVESF